LNTQELKQELKRLKKAAGKPQSARSAKKQLKKELKDAKSEIARGGGDSDEEGHGKGQFEPKKKGGGRVIT
jgi:hypothetical protein